MSNPNPQNKFQKANKQASKKLGQPNLVLQPGFETLGWAYSGGQL